MRFTNRYRIQDLSISFVVRFEQNKTTNIRAKTFIFFLYFLSNEFNSFQKILDFYIHWGFLIFYIPAEIIYLKFTSLIGFEKFNTMFKIWEFNVAKEVCFINFDVPFVYSKIPLRT